MVRTQLLAPRHQKGTELSICVFVTCRFVASSLALLLGFDGSKKALSKESSFDQLISNQLMIFMEANKGPQTSLVVVEDVVAADLNER